MQQPRLVAKAFALSRIRRLEPQLESFGLAWADIVPVLSAMDLHELRTAVVEGNRLLGAEGLDVQPSRCRPKKKPSQKEERQPKSDFFLELHRRPDRIGRMFSLCMVRAQIIRVHPAGP